MTRRKRPGLVMLACCAVGFGLLSPVSAGAAPQAPAAPAKSADTAGPDLLRAPPVDAPQLQNTGIWRASPIGVCMSSAYRAGEYVHQGCVYDDQGGGNQYRWPLDVLLRNYTYPEDPAYRRNAADILEVRAKPQADATAFRVTMNTMTDPKLLGLTLALGDSAAPRQAPHGANTVLPAQRFVTVHGNTGDITDAASGRTIGKPGVTVDVKRRQVEIRVPHSAFDPTGKRAVRLGAASGLWDNENDRYLVPQTTADKTHPGGAIVGDSTPSAFFDSAFRFDEPFEAPYRDNDQKRAIANGDLSDFHATVDFTKLASGVDDESGVPKSGYVTRVFASHSEKAQGRRLPSDPGGPPPGAGTQQGGINTGTGTGSRGTLPSMQFGWPCRDNCVSDLPGRMQRYMTYIPKQQAPQRGYASLTWTGGYALRPGDDVAGEWDLYQKFANRPGNPTMVINVDARGNDEWFYGDSGATVFEAIADARRHYRLDTERTTMGGFSSGAYGANKLSLQYPDVFNKAFICDGLNRAPSFPGVNGVADTLPVDTVTQHEPGSKISPMLPSRRNQPVMEWAGINDDFIPYNITRERADVYAKGDYDYEFVSWAGLAAEHLVMCKNGMWDMASKWMGDEPRAVNPHHVTYVRNPQMDDPASGLLANKAYWLSGIETRDGKLGTVDVVSKGLGKKDAPVTRKQTAAGLQNGTFSPVNPYTREFRKLAEPVTANRENVLEVRAENISSVTIDPKRAGVNCDAKVRLDADGPVRVRMLGCDGVPDQVASDLPPAPKQPDATAPGGNGQGGNGQGAEAGKVPNAPEKPRSPLAGLPFPAEIGNLPQLPLQGLAPLRFPLNVSKPPFDIGNIESPPLPF